jgi:hypothetical protein
MDEDLPLKAPCPRDKLVRYSARGRHCSLTARLAIVEESYATVARVADTAAALNAAALNEGLPSRLRFGTLKCQASGRFVGRSRQSALMKKLAKADVCLRWG